MPSSPPFMPDPVTCRDQADKGNVLRRVHYRAAVMSRTCTQMRPAALQQTAGLTLPCAASGCAPHTAGASLHHRHGDLLHQHGKWSVLMLSRRRPGSTHSPVPLQMLLAAWLVNHATTSTSMCKTSLCLLCLRRCCCVPGGLARTPGDEAGCCKHGQHFSACQVVACM